MQQRDRIYLVKDILTRLVEQGELNQSNLVLYCRLNLTKHKEILDEMERNDLITKDESFTGKKLIITYNITENGIKFYKEILEPYEKFFPRKKIQE